METSSRILLTQIKELLNSVPELSGLKVSTAPLPIYGFVSMQAEIRTLEFWRSIFAECLSTFFYVLIICSVNTSSSSSVLQTNVGLAAGLSISVLTLSFSSVSHCHSNPALSIASLLTKDLSPLRAILYIAAQCGGGIAGAALVLAVYSRISDPLFETGGSGGAFAMEFVLTTLLSYAFYASKKNSSLSHGLSMGLVNGSCLLSWRGSLNPARALGSAFVSKESRRFARHWIYWIAPLLGAITGAFSFTYIFNPRKKSGGSGLLELSPYSFTHTHSQVKNNPLASSSFLSVEDVHNDEDVERGNKYIQQGPSESFSESRANYRKGRNDGVESLYSKSLHNAPLLYAHEKGSRFYGDSKSLYSGIEEESRGSSNSRPTNRNPYDYLPDEPNKPDIIRKGNPYSSSNYETSSNLENQSSDNLKSREFGRGSEFGRLGRLRSEFYSPSSYNASYSQTNGCSINSSSPYNTNY